jgi:hypothetical protein
MTKLCLRLLEGELAVWRLPPDAAVPLPPPGAPLWSVTRTADELSVVSVPAQAPSQAAVETGWRALAVVGPLSFSMTGVLASLSSALAEAAVPIFVISTFDTDYLLVKEANLERAINALEQAGHSLSGS